MVSFVVLVRSLYNGLANPNPFSRQQTIFLNSEAEEEIYMNIPERLELLLNKIIERKTSQRTILVAER